MAASSALSFGAVISVPSCVWAQDSIGLHLQIISSAFFPLLKLRSLRLLTFPPLHFGGRVSFDPL